MGPRRELLLAIGAGALLGAAFFPAPLGFLAWFGFVPLIAALHSRIARGATGWSLFGLGFVFGLVFYGTGTHWIAWLSDVAMTTPWLKYPAWLLASAYLALFAGLACGLTGVLTRRSGVPLAWVFPFAFLAIEELRGSGEMGFPWFQPGYTQHAYAPVIQLASLGGVTLVTLWVLVVNALLWQAWTGAARRRSLAGALLLLAFPWGWGNQALRAAPRGAGTPVALVQGNIAGEVKWSGRHQPEILATFLHLSARAMRDSIRPAIVIWPETATGSYLRKQLEQAYAVVRFAAEHDVPVFSGYADFEYAPTDRRSNYNAAGVFWPTGSTEPVYAKRHLVPFGERMPFQHLIPGLGRLDFGQAEWTPGEESVLFPSAAGEFAALVCFESIFPDLARDDVRRGARWLVNITNDEWFGNGAALYQHAAMAQFRAVENHVPVARCANTGLTVLIDANGRVTARLPVFEPGVLVARLPLPGLPTPFTRFGDWPGVLAGLAVAMFAGLALWASRRATAPPE